MFGTPKSPAGSVVCEGTPTCGLEECIGPLFFGNGPCFISDLLDELGGCFGGPAGHPLEVVLLEHGLLRTREHSLDLPVRGALARHGLAVPFRVHVCHEVVVLDLTAHGAFRARGRGPDDRPVVLFHQVRVGSPACLAAHLARIAEDDALDVAQFSISTEASTTVIVPVALPLLNCKSTASVRVVCAAAVVCEVGPE